MYSNLILKGDISTAQMLTLEFKVFFKCYICIFKIKGPFLDGHIYIAYAYIKAAQFNWFHQNRPLWYVMGC